jgi:uncharacterized membrane protein
MQLLGGFMTTTNVIADRPDRLKGAFFLMLAAMFVFILPADESFWLQPQHAHWAHVRPFLPALLLHVVGGVVALGAGGLQFWQGLRKRRPDLHRLIGKIYLGATAIGGPAAFYIQCLKPNRAFFFAAIAHSLTWMVASALAFWSIRVRDFEAHRLWMMRSYGMCLLFITLRVPDAFPQIVFDDASATALQFGQILLVLIGIEILETVRKNRARAAKLRAR